MPAKPAKAGKAAKSPKPAKAAKAKPRKAAPPARAPRKPARPRAQPVARAEPAPEPEAWTEAPAEAPPAPVAVGVIPWSTPATPAGAWGGFSAAVDPRTLPLRPVKGLAGALVVLLVCSVGLTAVNLLFEFLVEDWGRPSAGAGVSVLQGILNALSSGASIALIIVFCMWLYRVLRNAEQRHPEAGLNPGWAVGSFFVPFVHLVLPYFEVRRGWRADVSPDSGPVTAWFVPWALGMAATYVTVILVVSISIRTVFAATRSTTPDLDAFYDQTHSLQLVAGAVGLVLNALAAFFLAQMARRWTAVQEGPPVS